MPAIFSKNCILTGELDSYCLACSVYLTSEEMVLSHIQSKKHKETQKVIGYFNKHQQDLIKKVNGVYFCEVCNITLSTASKVNIHVKQEAHLLLKRVRLLKRVEDHIVVDGKVSITDSAWHGLVDDTCVLCNVEFDDVSTHKCLKSHILNLLSNKVILDDNNYVYRKVEDTYQCLTCNKVVSEQLLALHLNEEEHKETFVECNKLQEIISKSNNQQNNTLPEKDVAPQKKADKGSESYIFDEHSNFKPGVKNEDKRDTSSTSSKSIPTTVEKFAKQHALNVKDDSVFCNICNISVPATHFNIEKHVTSNSHKKKAHKKCAATKKDPINTAKVEFEQYSKHLEIVECLSGIFLIINQKICVDFWFFIGLVKFQSKIICHFCDIDLIPENVLSHVNSPQHSDFAKKSLVITSLENEFVRQIKSNLYDCGYCGHTESEYDDMLDHLTTTEHKKHKTFFQEKRVEIKKAQAVSRHINHLNEMFIMQNFVNMNLFHNM